MNPKYSMRASAIAKRKKDEANKPETEEQRQARLKGHTRRGKSQQDLKIKKYMTKHGTDKKGAMKIIQEEKDKLGKGQGIRTFGN